MAGTRQKPVWSKRLKQPPDPLNLRYCAGRDVAERPMADLALLPYDIELNQAHALMLFRQKIISAKTHAAIQSGLRRLQRLHAAGRFTLDPALEDVHINVERFLARHAGAEHAGALHTGRSRNDQAATDVRMCLRADCLLLLNAVCDLVTALLLRAGATLNVYMPGFSHTQPAALTTFAHLLCSHAQALSRDLQRLQTAYAFLNQSPLGAAAGFGTSWPIQRESTARWLGFETVQENALDCVTNRWEMECQLVSALSFLAAHLSTLAQDLIFFSAHGLRYLRLPDAYVTGSSIMPQKRNPDFAEVTRAKAAAIHGALLTLLGIAKGAPSGYNRDSQWSKYIALDAMEEIRDAPRVFAGVIRGLELDTQTMARQAEANFITAVDLADYLSRTFGIPFRRSYELIAELVQANESDGCFQYARSVKLLARKGVHLEITEAEWRQLLSPQRLVQQKNTFGGPAAPAVRGTIARLRAELTRARQWSKQQSRRRERARAELNAMIERALR